jgi:hypothetical protein
MPRSIGEVVGGLWSPDSKIVRLYGRPRHVERDFGYDTATEDITALVTALNTAFPVKGGGYLGIGSWHNLDIALAVGAEKIVLMDIDPRIVALNKSVLSLIEQTDDFRSIIPRVGELLSITRTNRRSRITRDFDNYINGQSEYGNTPMLWGKDPVAFAKLRHLISEGRVAVARADVKDPDTMTAIGGFFAKDSTPLCVVNLTNVEDFDHGESWSDDQSREESTKIPNALRQAGAVGETSIISFAPSVRLKVKDAVRYGMVRLEPEVAGDSSWPHYIRSFSSMLELGPFLPSEIVGENWLK